MKRGKKKTKNKKSDAKEITHNLPSADQRPLSLQAMASLQIAPLRSCSVTAEYDAM